MILKARLYITIKEQRILIRNTQVDTSFLNTPYNQSNIPEARLQDRLEGIGHKSSSSRSTQVRGLPIGLEIKTNRSQTENIAHRSESGNKRISLVFTRLDNVPSTNCYPDATSKIHVINEKPNDAIQKPIFLGSIYNNRHLDVNPTNVKDTAQLICSSILNGIVETILISKTNENIILTQFIEDHSKINYMRVGNTKYNYNEKFRV